jgi:CBS domain-containing protein
MTTVAAILKEKGGRVIAVRPEDRLEVVVRTLAREKIGAVLVRDANDHVLGVISERDVVSGLGREGPGLLDRQAADLMTRSVVYCGPHDTIDSVMQRMTERRFRHMPVLEDETLLGIISIGDVVKARIAETELEAQSLKEYIATG